MPKLGSGFVFIVESPSQSDLLDGRTEGRTLGEALKLSGIHGWYSLVTSRETFYTALNERLVQAISAFPGEPPMIHFSMHGNLEGIQLTNNDFISWFELRAALSNLNSAMPDGLLICMSSCFGGSGCRMAMHEDSEKPFWALIGNINSASWNDAAVAYVTFYHHLFKGAAVADAVEAMKVASGDYNFVWYNGNAVKEDWASYMANIAAGDLANKLRAIGNSIPST